MQAEFDVIILGLGAMGSAATYQLSKRGVRVLGIDQYNPPHSLGSSHGETRMTRQAIGEGEQYVPLVLRSHEIWREVEGLTGRKLLYPIGGLFLGAQDSQVTPHNCFNFLQQTIDAAKKFDIKHDILDTAQLKKRFPQFNVTNETGYFEYNAGYLVPDLCIEAQLGLAQRQGATLHTNERVLEVTPASSNDKVTVRTDKGQYESERLIISAGPWVSQFLEPEYADLFKVYRQVMFWFNVDPNHLQNYSPNNCPVYVWIFEKGGEFGFYGFPSTDGRTIKMATEQFTAFTTPEQVDREVKEKEIKSAYEDYVKDRLIGITDTCENAVSCLYTTTPDSDFVIDFDPKHPQIIIASPCSGHGFKHSAAIGEVLADLSTTGRSKIDISKFSFNRFGR